MEERINQEHFTYEDCRYRCIEYAETIVCEYKKITGNLFERWERISLQEYYLISLRHKESKKMNIDIEYD